MANLSKLYSFLDDKHGISAKFLVFEGEDFLDGRSYFDLCFLHLLAYYKDQEQLCAYFDGEDQPVTYKLEASTAGQYRSLLSVGTDNFEPKLTGNTRVLKILPGQKSPTQSIVRTENQSPRDMVLEILGQSYQIDSFLTLEAEKGQSLLVSALPGCNKKSFKSYMKKSQQLLQDFAAIGKDENVIEVFKTAGFQHLTTLEMSRHCPCSKEYVLQSLKNVAVNDLFEEGKDQLDAHCDYCGNTYVIAKADLQNQSLN